MGSCNNLSLLEFSCLIISQSGRNSILREHCWWGDVTTPQLFSELKLYGCHTPGFSKAERFSRMLAPTICRFSCLPADFPLSWNKIFEYKENSAVSIILKDLFLSILNGKRNRKSMQTNFLAKGRIPFEWHWSYDTVPLQVCDLVIIFIIVFTDGDPIAGQFWESSGNPGLSRWIIIIPFQSVA